MKPWYRPPPEGHGSEEFVGPGGFEPMGNSAQLVAEHAQVAAYIKPTCESPIEVIFGAYFVRLLVNTRVTLVPQYRWHGYRMDFACLAGEDPILFVECDGRAFHSTPEQVANDRRKDEAARRSGIPLLRFTGSDIDRQGDACARVALSYLARHL